MNILLLTFKTDRGNALADALNKIGYNVSVDEIGKKKYSIIRNLYRVVFSYFRHHGKYDLVLTECFDYNGMLALLLSFFENTPYIIYVKGFSPDDAKEKSGKLTRFLDEKVNHMIFSKASAIAYISNHLKQKYEEYFRKKQKDEYLSIPSKVIHHSIDESYFKIEKRKRSENRVLYVGNLDFKGKADGVVFLLNIMKSHDETESYYLSIVGGGSYLPFIQSLAKEYGLRNVKFHGYITKKELQALYRDSSLFVYPSFQDAFPTVVMEAQAMGLPAIVTDTSGAKEVVIDGKTGYVVEAEPDVFHNALFKLLNNDELLKSMSEASKIHIKQNFRWEKSAEKFDELITSCIMESMR